MPWLERKTSSCHSEIMLPLITAQRTHDAMITSLLRQNDVTASFCRNDDVIITSCVRWVKADVAWAQHQITFWLTYWGRNKITAISQTTFSNAFSWMKIFKFRLRFRWCFFPRFQLTIFHHWFRWWLVAIPSLVQIMAWRRPGDKPLLNQWWLVYWRTRAQCVKSARAMNACLFLLLYQLIRRHIRTFPLIQKSNIYIWNQCIIKT